MMMSEYLALPAVSAGVIKAMVDECPRAAWFQSYLNPSRPRDDTTASDAGSIAHGILLEGSEAGVCVVDPNDHPAEKTGNIPDGWTNKSIRQARDAARESGLIPVLAPQMAEIRAMVDAARAYVSSIQNDEPFVYEAFLPAGGEAEVVFEWNDGGTRCKMRPDLITPDRRLIVNYKTTATSVAPERWGRGPFLDYLVGAAWYVRGAHILFDVDASYVYLVQSTAPPYLCSMVGVDPHAMAVGMSMCEVGLKRWQRCVERNDWPGYPPKVAYPELPPWVEPAWADKQMTGVFE